MSAQNFSNLINGKWLGSNDYRANINPSDTRDVVGEYAQGTKEDASNAIAAATAAFPKWSHSTPQQRFDLLDAAGTEILKRRDELGNLLAREEGKTLPEAIGEVARTGNIFKFFAGEALRITGDSVASVRPEIGVEVMVNLPTAGVDYHVPFGGRKGSSFGSREQGTYAAEFFTTVKTSYTCS